MSLAERVGELIAAFEQGEATEDGTIGSLRDLVSMDTVDELMGALPDQWRELMIGEFRRLQNVTSSEDVVTLKVRTYTSGFEPDPVVRERMIRERREADARDRERFVVDTVPAMRKWLEANGIPVSQRKT